MGPKCNHKCPHVREPRKSKEEVGEVRTKVRRWGAGRKEPWTKECRHPPNTGKGKETHSSSETLEGTIPAHTLTSAQWTDFGCVASFRATEFVVICNHSDRKGIQHPKGSYFIPSVVVILLHTPTSVLKPNFLVSSYSLVSSLLKSYWNRDPCVTSSKSEDS